jgi:hypothetical protein
LLYTIRSGEAALGRLSAPDELSFIIDRYSS